MTNVTKDLSIQEFSDNHGVSAISEHTDLYRGNVAVFGQYFQLFAQFSARCIVHRLHTFGTLHRHRSNSRHPVTTVSGKSFQIGRNARAARRIESSDGKQ